MQLGSFTADAFGTGANVQAMSGHFFYNQQNQYHWASLTLAPYQPQPARVYSSGPAASATTGSGMWWPRIQTARY